MQNSLKPLIIHHSKDLDGITSAVLTQLYWHNFLCELPALYVDKFNKPTYIGFDYSDNEKEAFKNWKDYNYIIFIDVTPSVEFLQELKDSNIVVEIYDHHHGKLIELMESIELFPSEKLNEDYKNNSIIRVTKDNINFTITKNYSASYIYSKTIFSKANHYVDSLLSICVTLKIININLTNYITKYPEFKLPRKLFSILNKNHELIEYSFKRHENLNQIFDYLGLSEYISNVDNYDVWKWNKIFNSQVRDKSVSECVEEGEVEYLKPLLVNEGFWYFKKYFENKNVSFDEDRILNQIAWLFDEPFVLNTNTLKRNIGPNELISSSLYSVKYLGFSIPNDEINYRNVRIFNVLRSFISDGNFIDNPEATEINIFLFRLMIQQRHNLSKFLINYGIDTIERRIKKTHLVDVKLIKHEFISWAIVFEKYDFTMIDYLKQTNPDLEFVLFLNEKDTIEKQNKLVNYYIGKIPNNLISISARSLTQSDKIDLSLMMKTLFDGGGHFHASGGATTITDLHNLEDKINHYIYNLKNAQNT